MSPRETFAPSLWHFLPIADVQPRTRALNIHCHWEATPASSASLQNCKIAYLDLTDAFENRADEWEVDPVLLVFGSSYCFSSGSARLFYLPELLMGKVKCCGVTTEMWKWSACGLASEALFSISLGQVARAIRHQKMLFSMYHTCRDA